MRRRPGGLALATGAALLAGAMSNGVVAHAGTAHLVLNPSSSSITAGGHQSYTAHFIDAFGNDLGDVTAVTVFALDDASGSCTQATCTETKPGTHTVTGTDGLASGHASLTVNPGPLDHLTLSPNPKTITANDPPVAYTAEGFDAYGNDLGDMTAFTTFTVDAHACTVNFCSPTTPGDHTVTGDDGGKTGTATLHVNVGPLDHLTLSPASTFIPVGGHQTYTAEGF
ncbi:MAG: hypothetical protein E6I76_20610, partial [Chloroflexi bacterium]